MFFEWNQRLLAAAISTAKEQQTFSERHSLSCFSFEGVECESFNISSPIQVTYWALEVGWALGRTKEFHSIIWYTLLGLHQSDTQSRVESNAMAVARAHSEQNERHEERERKIWKENPNEVWTMRQRRERVWNIINDIKSIRGGCCIHNKKKCNVWNVRCVFHTGRCQAFKLNKCEELIRKRSVYVALRWRNASHYAWIYTQNGWNVLNVKLCVCFVFGISEPKRLEINSVFIFIVPLSPVSDSPFYNVSLVLIAFPPRMNPPMFKLAPLTLSAN